MPRRYRVHHHWTQQPVFIHEPRNSGESTLPMILVSVFGISLTANGLCLLLGLQFLFCLLIAVPIYGTKLYILLRRQSRYGDDQGGNYFGYAILTGALLLMMPFGLYGFGHTALGVKSESQVNAPNSTETFLATQPTSTNGSSDGEKSESFFEFLTATGRKETYPIVCWIVALVIEAVTLLLGLLDRRDDYYWD